MGAQRPGQLGQLGRVGRPVVGAVDERPLEREPPALGVEVRPARGHEVAERVAAVDRHQVVAQRVVGRVQRHGQVHREALLREPADAGDDPDGRDRDVARRDAEVVVQSFDRRPHAVVVRHRLAHAHEHDVAQPTAAGAGPPSGPDDLLDDLADCRGCGRSRPGRWRRSRTPSRSRPASTRTRSTVAGSA